MFQPALARKLSAGIFRSLCAAYRAQRDEAIALSPGQKDEVAHNCGHMQKSA